MKRIETNKYAYSDYGERYYGEFDTKEEAILEFMIEYPYQSGYIGNCIKYEFTEDDCDTFSENILEMMDETLGDICGEYSEDWLSSISREQENELNSELAKVIVGWLNRNNLQPSVFMIEEPEEFNFENKE